jgi:hypothetical protein
VVCDVAVRADSAITTELLWGAEVHDSTHLQGAELLPVVVVHAAQCVGAKESPGSEPHTVGGGQVSEVEQIREHLAEISEPGLIAAFGHPPDRGGDEFLLDFIQ